MRGAASREELISRDSQQSLISLKEDPQVETDDASLFSIMICGSIVKCITSILTTVRYGPAR